MNKRSANELVRVQTNPFNSFEHLIEIDDSWMVQVLQYRHLVLQLSLLFGRKPLLVDHLDSDIPPVLSTLTYNCTLNPFYTYLQQTKCALLQLVN